MKTEMNKISILTIVISFALSALFYIFFNTINNFGYEHSKTLKFILCWVGIAELIFIMISWKKSGKKILSLYILFMIFFFLFNFGQCFLWAFNIHTQTEIGNISLFYRLGIPSQHSIVKAQLIILVSALMIHVGAMIVSDKYLKGTEKTNQNYIADNKNLLKFCKLIFLPVVFCEFYYQIINIINARQFGYTSLYYNPNVQTASVIIQVIARLFFPVIIGLLFSSNYDKKIMRITYATFIVDIILSIMVGDRGGWLYSAIILLICHNNYYKKFNKNQILSISILGYLSMIVLIAVRNIRNYGVTLQGIINFRVLSFFAPIVDSLNEIGGTMGITVALMMKGWRIFPYGNSFLYGLLISPSKRLIKILNLNFESVSSWFSQTYLRISNGAGFSIIGEVLINYGPYVLLLIMILIGIIVGGITNIENLDFEKDKVKLILKVTTTSVIVNISRNCFSYNMGEVLYTTILFYFLFSIYRVLPGNKEVNNEK